jgi:hypothetical protein
MKVSTSSVSKAAVAVVSAGILSIAQTVAPLPPERPAPAVHLVADVQPLVPRPHVQVMLDAPPPAAAPLAVPIAPNLANTIDSVYLAVEPWVEYGFAVAASVVAWIPYVGWASGFIMDGYFFGESLVASGVFNFTDWLRGDGGIVTNLVDFGIDVGLAFVWLGLDIANTFIPLPPCNCYPPRPPVQGPFLAAADTLMAPAETRVAEESVGDDGQQSDEDEQSDEDQQSDEEVGDKQNAEQVVSTEQPEQDTTGEDEADVDDDQETVDISAAAQEDATAGSEDATEDATEDAITDSPETVDVQGEVQESVGAAPIDADAQLAAASPGPVPADSTDAGNDSGNDSGGN